MSELILVLICFTAIFCGCYKTYCDYKWNLKPLHNFPFFYRGKEYWYSRSVATSPFVFCKNSEGKWCVLANKRGVGTPDYQGYWNVPCGYLEHNVSGEENCSKEVYEECGVDVSSDMFKFIGVETLPSANRQNVTLRYYALMDGLVSDYSFDSENSEENEVSDIKWIPIDEVDNYQWAFNHNVRIKEIYEKVLENNNN